MPKLTVTDSDVARAILFSPGASVLEILAGAGISIRVGCRGDGACGLCLVQIEAGEASPPTRNERLILPPEQLARSIRLACQLLPENDLQLRVIAMASKSNWRDLAPGFIPCTPSLVSPSNGRPAADATYGLAIDLGTTQVSLSLWDLKGGRRLQGRIGPNPQSLYGADVVARLIAAGESKENARRISCLPLEAVAEALREMCLRAGCQPQEIIRAAFVGNTAMLSLLTEADSRLLLKPDNWTRPLEYSIEQPHACVSLLGIQVQATLEVISPLAGFVGSDLLAGVLATGLTDQPGSLLLDFGTNSEMALWDGKTLWVTSAAGGPAFESCGMQCGMPAEPGAIYRFEGSDASREIDFDVLGGGEAKGFCGSGLVDLIACLRDSGELTSVGSFGSQRHQDGYAVPGTDPVIRLTKNDVDTFQRAKSASGAGISTMLTRAEMSATELNRICVCGVFGSNLNVRNAQRIGLLPDAAPERVELCGNTALAGCERLLLSPERNSEMEALRERSAIINLSQSSDFDDLFLENLYLQPLRVETT
jgi:uncharacterized 2Fe-2S/4Fe-4S cluster protein (DUF4445 family)